MQRAIALCKIDLTVMDMTITMAQPGDKLLILDVTQNGAVYHVALDSDPLKTFYADSNQIEVQNDSIQ